MVINKKKKDYTTVLYHPSDKHSRFVSIMLFLHLGQKMSFLHRVAGLPRREGEKLCIPGTQSRAASPPH